ncbi:MAG: tyrosine-type recombinase/integrase [Ignavibacteriaceae bacterium]|nr:MAG: tyrosine-type recombinase/integrase [Ignavibacteriaceae bacterium]MBV6445511.1 Tyrosine recombinase XerC [Ignavibacteriaceae bacterium]OQY74569.1 MAG: hypothetical protein B6D45_06690 [Ignavibacteriales bacterium UTCHB3]WKZ73231.1 MAG: tyrosine-type recombinase/integrase [Ignavibacteriaceae bacterium]
MNLTVKKKIDDYLSYLRKSKLSSDNTVAAYSNDLNGFAAFCEDIGIQEVDSVTIKTVKRYLSSLNSLGLDRSSIARKMTSLRVFFNYLLDIGVIEYNFVKDIKNPKFQRKLPDIVSEKEFESTTSLAAESAANSYNELLHTAILELLYGCSLRVSEVCTIKAGDVDLVNGKISVTGKGSKMRIVPVGGKSSTILKNFWEVRKSLGYHNLFLSQLNGKAVNQQYVYRLVRKLLSASTDIRKKSPHVLRHSSATHMLDNGADLLAIKEILGHENLSTTQIYTQVSIERLKGIYKKAHPKS